MGKKPVRINTNEELDRRSRKILQRNERSAKPRGPAMVTCHRCKGQALRDDLDGVYHCIQCSQEWDIA